MTRLAATVSPPDVDAWAYARALSPRSTVRVADVDPDTGRPINRYSTEQSLMGPAPDRPYAVYLADRQRRFRLLGFDLDPGKGPVTADLARLRALLHRAGLPHMVCASGPTGGRHVWVALVEPAGADTVARLARALARMLPSLDVAPLCNARTGALRPPGAPHRLAGTSTVLHGDPAGLLTHPARLAQLLALAALAEQAAPPQPARPAGRAIGTDPAGRRHLLGARQLLPPASRRALDTPLPATADASAALATVLSGAARARWRFADVAALLEHAPGLEHARSERTGPGRAQRRPADALRLLLRQWERAVDHVAGGARRLQDTDDPGLQHRARTCVDTVAAAQARADAAPGRWARPGGPADRRVLDELCRQSLAALRTGIELDVRRLALACGIGRETARTALHRLTADGWARQQAPAAGVRAATWALPTPAELSTATATSGRSQADPRAVAGPWDARTAWQAHLTSRQDDVAHDAFTPAGLGHHAGRIYQSLTRQPTSSRDLAVDLGYPLHRIHHHLDELAGGRLAGTGPGGTWTRRRGTLDQAALAAGTNGTLTDRAHRYALEREAWAWWGDELAWRTLPRDAKKRRRDPAPGQGTLPLEDVVGLTVRRRRGAHPARPSGRADFARALAAVRGDSASAQPGAA